MNFIPPLYSLFERFNSLGIHYCIIRDFEGVDQVNTSSDVDVVVKKTDRNQARTVLGELGWLTQSLNSSLYSHEQYYKWNGSTIVVLDIVWDIFYSDGKYELSDQNDVYKSVERLDNSNIPRSDVAIMLLVLHLLFDKKEVSEKNYNQLKRLYSIGNDSAGLIHDIARSIIENRGFSPNYASRCKRQIIKAGILKCRMSFYIKPIRKLKLLVKSIKRRMRLGVFFNAKTNPLKVALIGMDGAGKSSTIQKLQEYYKGSYIQYMGFREGCWESPLAKRWICFGKLYGFFPQLLCLIKNYIAIVYDGFYRYRKSINAGTDLVLFDRYYSEKCNGSKGLDKLVFFTFIKLFYPKPDIVFYLHCSVEESLRRKDDIDDIDGFIKTKNIWDKVYLNQKKVVAIDTEVLKEDDVFGIIIENITAF